MPSLSRASLPRILKLAIPVASTAIAVAVLPLFAANGFAYTVFTGFCINLVLLIGLNLISGYGGQLSLGQAAFYGAGAYMVTLGTVKLHLSPALCLLLAPIVGAAFAVLVGIPSLRLRGLYFAMATLGVAVVFQLWLDRTNKFTGGPNGLAISDFTIFGLDFSDPPTVYAAAATVAVLGVLVSELFLRTNTGRGLRAAHASEPAAAVVGVDVFSVRLAALAACGAYAGIAGALQAFNTLYVSPTSFSFFGSVTLFFVLTIGGLATWSGPLFGAALLLVFDKFLNAYSDREPLILAAVFVLALRLFPRGAGQAVDNLVNRLLAAVGPRSPVPVAAPEAASEDA